MAPSSQAAQAGLLVAMQSSVDAAWQQLDVADLSNTIAAYTQAVYAITHRFGQASAALAMRSYLTDRTAAGVTSSFTPRPAPLPPPPQVGATVNWATQPLWSATPDVPAAQTNIEGSIGRLVQNVGRQTVIDSVRADKKARAWARVPEPGACSFCLMIAQRGPVFKEKTVGFASHDHCKCHPEPVFGIYEAPADVRAAQALYRESTAGLRGQAALNAFRVAVDASRAPAA